MKLNKILALALSGVMAVSMLAGCSSNGKDDGEVIVTPATGAAATLNKEQEKVVFTDGSNASLQKATSALTTAELEALGNTLGCEAANGTVGKVLVDLGVDNIVTSYNDFNNNTNTDKELTKTVVFKMGGALTMDAVLEKVAADIDTYVSAAGYHGYEIYLYSYTGTVSTVTATSVDGTVSGNYVMVTITQTAEKA